MGGSENKSQASLFKESDQPKSEKQINIDLSSLKSEKGVPGLKGRPRVQSYYDPNFQSERYVEPSADGPGTPSLTTAPKALKLFSNIKIQNQ